MVMVLDAEGQQQPGIELLVRWDGQDGHFFTGLKPEVGPGYADFGLKKGVIYQVLIIGAESQTRSEECASPYFSPALVLRRSFPARRPVNAPVNAPVNGAVGGKQKRNAGYTRHGIVRARARSRSREQPARVDSPEDPHLQDACDPRLATW